VEINSTIAGDHCDPGPKRRSIAQRVKLFERMKKDVLHEVVNFSSRHTGEQNAMHEWRIQTIEFAKPVPITFQDRRNQHSFDRCRWRMLGGVYLGAYLKHVECGGHCDLNTSIKTGER